MLYSSIYTRAGRSWFVCATVALGSLGLGGTLPPPGPPLPAPPPAPGGVPLPLLELFGMTVACTAAVPPGFKGTPSAVHVQPPACLLYTSDAADDLLCV